MTARAKKTRSRRNVLLGLIHKAMKEHRVPDEGYRDWLEKRFGVRSAAVLTLAQLEDAVEGLRYIGWLDGAGRGNSTDPDRPTPNQWAKLAALSREMGWKDALESKGLKTFTKRIAKVDSPRFLNRKQARNVIAALQKWRNNLDRKVPGKGTTK